MQKLRHLNSSTVDKDGVLQTTVTFGWLDPSYGAAYQSRQIVYSPMESPNSPTDTWIVGTLIDHYQGGVKRYACYPVLEIWDKVVGVSPSEYDVALAQIKADLNLQACAIVKKDDLLEWLGIRPTFSEAGILTSFLSRRFSADSKLSTTVLQAAGIDTDKALPKLYDKLNCDYSRHLPSLCRNGVEYFNVEFTENIDLLGYYDIVGYDYGLRVRALPRFYEIHPSGGFAEGPRGRVSLGVKK